MYLRKKTQEGILYKRDKACPDGIRVRPDVRDASHPTWVHIP